MEGACCNAEYNIYILEKIKNEKLFYTLLHWVKIYPKSIGMYNF